MSYSTWTQTDPGAGSSADIRAAASSRVADGDAARAAGTALLVQGERLAGATADALASQVEVVRTEILGIASQHQADAAALAVYAGEVERIRAAQRSIESEQRAIGATTHRLGVEAQRLRTQRRSWAAQDQEDKVWQLDHQLMVNSQQATFTATEMQRLDRRMDALAEERRIADAACVVSLCGPDSRGGLGSGPGAPGVLTSSASLSGLSQLSQLDILTLLQANPNALDNLAGPPEEVAEWWGGLTLEQQTALVLAAPAFIGSLDGIPVMSRVAANRLVARDQLEKDRGYLAQWAKNREGTDGPDSNPGFWEGQDKRIKEVEERARYLEQVIAGEVQLYLYDHESSRIIEMIGSPSAETTKVVTYVPGTFSSPFDFYRGGVQQIANYLHGNDPNLVAFVYKDGVFPGEDTVSGTADLTRIGEANDQDFGRASGETLAAFQSGMRLDPRLGNQEQIAIGHSWGLANITSSEVAGVKYDKVVSLSGAGMLPEWEPVFGTEYVDFSYRDLLQTAQDLDVVWDGNNPREHPAFEHGDYYRGPNDDVLDNANRSVNVNGTATPMVDVRTFGVLMDNHNLIASGIDENLDNVRVLRDLERWLAR